jgi:hypothetical protein
MGVCLSGLFVLAFTSSASGAEVWTGSAADAPESSVALKVVAPSGKPKRVVVEVTGVPLRWEDGSSATGRIEEQSIVVRHHRFSSSYAFNTGQGTRGLRRISGVVNTKTGQASGRLLVIDSPFNPPSNPGPPDCSTTGFVDWIAARQ